MVSDAVFQILLILAYLTIGLISVTFPIYTLCNIYLKREMWETEKERKRRIEELKENIAKRTEELSGERKDSQRFKELQREIKNCKAELRSQRLRVFRLKAIGAVGLPIILLVISLFIAAIGIYFFYEGFEVGAINGIIGSALFCGIALYSIYKTISAVEHAALRPARTVEFEVCYESGEISQEIKLGKKRNWL